MVALEITGVDLDLPDDSRSAQLQDRPVVTGSTPAARFPSITHIRGPTRHDHVLNLPEVHIARGNSNSSVLHCCEVNEADACVLAPIRNDRSVDAQSCNPAVRINIETDVRPPA